MKSRFKVALSAMLGILIMALAASSIFTDLVYQQAIEEKKNLSSRIRKTTRVLIEAQNEQMADRLVHQIENSIATPKSADETEFRAVGLVRLADEGLQVDWLRSANPELNQAWLTKELAGVSIPLKKLNVDDSFWFRVSGPDQQIYFLFAVPIQVKSQEGDRNQVAVGLLQLSAFASVNLVAKGEKDEVFIVDGEGNTFSYPDQQYVGSKITSHPVVAALFAGQQQDEYISAGGERIVGGYEHIFNSNLYVISAGSIEAKMFVTLRMLMQVFLVALALMTAVAFAIFFVLAREQERVKILEDNFAMVQNSFGRSSDGVVIDRGDERLRDFAKAVVQYLRKPLTTLTGLAQIGEAKTSDKAVKGTFDKIVTESRRAREFTDLLSQQVGYSEPPIEVLSLMPVLDQVVSIYKNQMVQNKIQFEENLVGEYNVRADFDGLKESLKTLMNFVTGFVGEFVSAKKKIVVFTQKVGAMAEITFEGHGGELKSDLRRSLFLPFRAPMRSSQLLGMDMALAYSHIADFNGEVMVESIGIEGFRVIVRLPMVISLNKNYDEGSVNKVNEPTPTPTLISDLTPIAVIGPPPPTAILLGPADEALPHGVEAKASSKPIAPPLPTKKPTAPPIPVVEAPAVTVEVAASPTATTVVAAPAVREDSAVVLDLAMTPESEKTFVVKTEEDWVHAKEEFEVVIRRPKVRFDL